MLTLRNIILLLACLSFKFCTIQANLQQTIHGVDKLNEENWDCILTGEWMIEFYAPWCPACKNLESAWEYLASWKKDLNIGVAKIDVTDSPGLSGRFMVTALPTIYHVKDGVFRQFKSPRDKDSLVDYVSEKTWMKVEPIPSWKSPTSITMSFISHLFRMSQVLRGVHSRLMEDFGLPTWGSYLIFAITTIVLGAILGLIIVCIIDFIYPPKDSSLQNKKKPEIVENVQDDLVDEEDSGSDKSEGRNKDASAPNTPNPRKRKPRKAD